jgi:hypothetical protein
MPYHFTTTELIVAAVVLVFVVIAVVEYFLHRKDRTAALRKRFGSEYDNAVHVHGSSQKAEARLADRETHVDTLKIRELGATERDRFVTEWQGVQSRFVDHPKAAVTHADELIAVLLEARGYPKDTFEQRAADVSVTHPRVVNDYRVAHAIAVRTQGAEASTEELRTAMIQFRTIFEELVQVQNPQEKRSAA